MGRKFYTVLIVPPSRPRFRKLQLSRGFLVCVGVLLAGLLVAGLLSTPLLVRERSAALDVDRLQHDNVGLRAERDRLEGALRTMAGRLEDFEARASRIAQELGVDEAEGTEPAAGGPPADGLSAGALSDRDELRSLRSRSDRLADSFEQLNAVFEERMRLLASTPNMMPAQGWFSHGYGWRKDPFTGERGFHRGVDIVAPKGSDILATADGVVTRAGRNGAYGKAVDLSHGYGYATRYAHMSELLVRAGQRVQRGDVLGRVGSTGRSTGPHLHYEIFRDGRRVNPWKHLGQKGR